MFELGSEDTSVFICDLLFLLSIRGSRLVGREIFPVRLVRRYYLLVNWSLLPWKISLFPLRMIWFGLSVDSTVTISLIRFLVIYSIDVELEVFVAG